MINLIISDFDNTLADLAIAHFEALNRAIEELAGPEYTITDEEQNSFYNGLSTKTKLDKLVKDKNLPKDKVAEIAKLKQELTISAIEETLTEDPILRRYIQALKCDGYKLAVASNAMKATVEAGLKKLGIYDLFDYVIGNDNLTNPKPHPEIYLKVMSHFSMGPEETLILEDNAHGKKSALASKAHLLTVDNPTDWTYDYIKAKISSIKEVKVPHYDDKLNVLVLMAGRGSRFSGNPKYTKPKPLIDVNGIPMIKAVIDNLNIKANYIFMVQKSHVKEYYLDVLLPLICPGCKIIEVDGITEGAACTALLAKEYIDNDLKLLTVNADQILDWNSFEVMGKMSADNVDGGILTFEASGNKWSYAKIDESGFVSEVKEKIQISNKATCGLYFFSKGSDFCKYAENMIEKDIRVNNEFYLCPVYNEMILDGKKIKTYDIEKMWGIGVPEDLEKYLLKIT